MHKLILTFPILFLLAGCGPRQVKLLNKLYPNMTKESVKLKIGNPSLIHAPKSDKNGNTIDIWEYNLATTDKKKKAIGNTLQLCGWFLFWPALLHPAAWEHPYDYDTYFLKFINNLLKKWGHMREYICENVN